MLQVTNLVKDYRGGKNWIRAVDHVSFQCQPGEIVGILGPNGAGKTTALRCIAGILRATSGEILINGHDLHRSPAKSKQGLAYVPEVPALYELLTVGEHLRFIAMCFDTLEIYEAQGEQLLAKYHLLDKKDELVATLSKGMRQKLSVACAMVHRANVFLFDEPLIGIDPAGAAEFKQELRDARDQGASILISTHLLDTAERLCDRILIFNKGRLVFEGTLNELRTLGGSDEETTLEELFLRITGDAWVEGPPVSHL